eukprot:365733-Chlamydomonas_euryale.AAC.3
MRCAATAGIQSGMQSPLSESSGKWSSGNFLCREGLIVMPSEWPRKGCVLRTAYCLRTVLRPFWLLLQLHALRCAGCGVGVELTCTPMAHTHWAE